MAALLLCVLALIPVAGHAATNDLTALLQQGLFEEQANRNLDAAIASYQSLAAQFDKDRQFAATAVFRLGECYRALGKTNEATAQYQRILKDFSDQTTLATLSQQNLNGMGVSATSRFIERLHTIATSNMSDANDVAATAADAEAATLKAQMDAIEHSTPEKQRIYVQQNVPNPVLTKLMQDLAEAEQKLASLKTDYSPQHPEVIKATALVTTISRQVDDQINGVLDGLRVKYQAALNKSRMLHDQLAQVQPGQSATSPVTDDEEKEIQRIQQMIQNSPDLINAQVNGGTPLTKAATNGWIKVATYLLDHGADVNADWGGALYGAAKVGNRAMVELLLSRGADVNPKEYTGQTPLHIAAENGFQAVVEVLLANKANVNAQIGSGVTPLFLAAGRDHPKIVSLLLEHKADVNAQDQSGMTPLINAAYSGHPENVKLLLAAGANPNLVGSDDNSVATGGRSGGRRGGGLSGFEGRTALSFAARYDPPEMVKMLLDAKADPNVGKLDAPLFSAIQNQAVASTELLLQAGANPNAVGAIDQSDRGFNRTVDFANNSRHLTPLWLAIYMKQLPMVQLLLKFKADPNDSQTDGKPLLFSALTDTNVLETLLAAGAKVDPISPDENEWTPLGAAARQNFVAALEILLKHGANPNVRNRNGVTPLHWAAYGLSDRKIFELLLANKADPNVRSNNGETPLDSLKNFQVQYSSGNGMPVPRRNISSEQIKLAGELADLLRLHGALDKLPDWDRITVSRPSANFSRAVFQKGTNDWNQFTLLETILNFYQSQSQQVIPRVAGGKVVYSGNVAFPDLAQVTIIRHSPGTMNEARIKINLLDSTNGIDCAKDVPLEFGDVVEIPERDHALGDLPVGLTSAQGQSIVDHLKGNVQLVTHDMKVELQIYPFPAGSELGSVLRQQEAQKMLLSSSDLSRVKVIRRDAKTGKMHEWIVDCSDHQSPSDPMARLLQARAAESNGSQPTNSQPSPDLWLRDGDVVEVPEKP